MQYKYVALSVTTVGTLMAGVDTRIVLVGMPTIASELKASVEEVIWVSQAYIFASTLGMLLIGRTTDLVGRVKIYNYGFAVFTVGSALAAFSFTPLELILSRMVQGVGAAMLIINAGSILTDATPRQELGSILGLNTIAFRMGSVIGLTLSGVILSITDWRALFYINIPIGIFGTVWAHYRLKEISTKDTYKGVDWPGFFTFASGLGLLLLAITYLSYGISGYLVGFGMLAAGAALLILFVFIELRHKHKSPPILDPELFKIREFAGGSTAQMINAIAWSGVVILASFYMQLVAGFSPFQTGIHLLALDAGFIAVGPIAGRLSDRYGSRIFTMAGLALSSVAFLTFHFINSSNGVNTVLIGLGILGVGSGLWVSPNISSVMGSVPPNRRGIASGFRMTLSNVGDTASFGLAILIMTLAIPYNTLNSLVQSYSTQSVVSATAKQEFILGFQLVALVLAAINTIAIFPASFNRRMTSRVTQIVE